MSGQPSGIITLLTDFGLDDPYVGIMKAVVLSAQRHLTIVDVCHGVPAQNVDVGALWLAHAFSWFPPGSVHVAVVDPGVGSERAALAARAGGHWFLAPDNGLLARVQKCSSDFEARRLEPAKLGVTLPSRTFHGRDLFAKVAASLAAGALAFEELGLVHAPRPLDVTVPMVTNDGAIGRVVAVDHYGNLITDLPEAWLAGRSAWVKNRRLRTVGAYAEASPRECVVLVNSFGLLEIAARDESAAELLGIGAGERLLLRAESEGS
jgi:S-adenosylmethionine hydrolase